MITDLILAGVSFVGLLVYATIGVTVFQIFDKRLNNWCHRSGHAGCFHHDVGSRAMGVFWAAVLLVMYVSIGFWRVAASLSKGPAAWGTWLAELGTHRANRKQALRDQVKDRDAMIARLEEELGMAA